jgi:hypothetical protein
MKTLKIVAVTGLICLFIGGIAGWNLRKNPGPVKPIYNQDIKPPVNTVIIPPVKDNYSDLWKRANAEINITRKVIIPEPYKGTFELGILASDTYKSKYVTDSITVPNISPSWEVYVGAALLYKSGFSYMAEMDATKYYGRFGIRAGAGIGPGVILIRGGGTIVFY